MMISETLFERAEQILQAVRAYASEGSDVAWTTWDTPAAMRAEIDACIEKIRMGDAGGVEQAVILFLPTGDFQEHSISNGWGEVYLRLSAMFDEVARSLLKD